MNGRFLKRGKIKKPPEMQSSDMRLDSLFYGPEDLYVGAIVEFNKHTFLLTSADDYVFAYMERPSEIEMVNGFSKFGFFFRWQNQFFLLFSFLNPILESLLMRLSIVFKRKVESNH